MITFAFIALLLCVACVWLLMPRDMGKHRIVTLTVLAAMLPGAAGLYWLAGSPKLIPAMEERNLAMATLEREIEQSEEQLRKTPEDAESWVKLGSLLMQAGRTAEAVTALQHAVVKSQGHPSIILLYARALIEHDEGRVGEDAYQSLKMVLLQEPKNAQARYWMAIYYVQHEQKKEALTLLRGLADELPDMAPIKGGIVKLIQELEKD